MNELLANHSPAVLLVIVICVFFGLISFAWHDDKQFDQDQGFTHLEEG